MMAMIDRDEIMNTGVIPRGLQLLQDSRSLQVLDLKKGVMRNPLLESKMGIKEIPIMRCVGIFQKCDEKNANGRIYPKDVLKEAVKKIQKPITERGAMGEWDHPVDAKIHLDRVSHLITKLWMDNKNVLGEIEIINDERCPCGSMMACYLDRNMKIGISSRGVGDMELVVVEGQDAYQVQEGYEFITFDAVAEPSVTGTQLKRLEEARERQTKIFRNNDFRKIKESLLIGEVRKLMID